jgi:polyisoprenoid-binding protein YceI
MTAATPLPTGTWSVDPRRSRIGFRVRQGFGAVRGAFAEFEGTLEVGDDLASAKAYGSVSVASLDTEQARRDAHLRSPAFLDAERYPELTFASRSIRRLDAERLEIAGDLTLHGVTLPLTLTAELEASEDPADDARVALAVTGELNRRDYGVTPSPVLDLLVSHRVDLQLDIVAVEQPAVRS